MHAQRPTAAAARAVGASIEGEALLRRESEIDAAVPVEASDNPRNELPRDR
jgi:hypothetical protein